MEGHLLKVEALSTGESSRDLASRLHEMIERMQRIRDDLAKTAERRSDGAPRKAPAGVLSLLGALSLEPSDDAALRKTLQAFEEDPKAKTISAAIDVVDRICWDYGLFNLPEVKFACEEFVTRTCLRLREAQGEAFPLPGFSGPIAAQARNKGYDVQEILVPSPRGFGEVSHVVRRGLRGPGLPSTKVVLAISTGCWGDAAELVDQASRLLVKENGVAAKDLRRILWQFVDADPEVETGLLRLVVNRLWDLEIPAAQDVRKRLLGALEMRGVKLMLTPVGSVFNSSHSPAMYDTTPVVSKAPARTIVAVLRPGFLDSDGRPIQKALLALSTGTGR